MKSKTLLLTATLAFLVVPPSHAESPKAAKRARCAQQFSNAKRNLSFIPKAANKNWKEFSEKVKQIGARRIFLKDAAEPPQGSKLYGFLTLKKDGTPKAPITPKSFKEKTRRFFRNILESPSTLAQRVMGGKYEFNPANALVHRPVRYLTQSLWGKPMQLTNWFTVPTGTAVGLGTSIYMFGQFDQWVDSVAEKNQLEGYDALVQSDYRLRQVRADLKAGKITRDQSRVGAMNLHALRYPG